MLLRCKMKEGKNTKKERISKISRESKDGQWTMKDRQNFGM